MALVESPEGWLLQRRPNTGLLAGLWQPMLWQNTVFETAAAMQTALAERGIQTAAPYALRSTALPAARHIFSHVEWQMQGWRFFAPAQPAPDGFVWAGRAQLEAEYALPGAFKVYKKLMLEDTDEP